MEITEVISNKQIEMVSRLAYAYFPVYYANVNPKHVQDYLDRYQSVGALTHQVKNNFAYYLVHSEGEAIGYIGLEELEDKIQLSKIYLDPKQRGKGVGHKLMDWIKNWTKNRGHKRIDLYVMQDNPSAIQFYKKQGFSIVGEFQEKFDSGEVEYNHIMSYQL